MPTSITLFDSSEIHTCSTDFYRTQEQFWSDALPDTIIYASYKCQCQSNMCLPITIIFTTELRTSLLILAVYVNRPIYAQQTEFNRN